MTEKCRLRLNLPHLLGLIVPACVCLLPIRAVSGACMLPIATVACEFLNSDAVFVGAVVSVKVAPARGDEYQGWLYDLTVQQLFRGPQTKTIHVFTENSSGRFPLDLGKRYLIFAYEYDGRLEIDNCGNSALVSAAELSLRELPKLQIPKDAVIEGNISLSGVPDKAVHLSGIRVVLRSTTASVDAVSDHDGWFHFHVPPGTYSAEVDQVPKVKIVPFSLTVDRSHLEARAGRCTGLRFTEELEE
jgi:hypothetical protein